MAPNRLAVVIVALCSACAPEPRAVEPAVSDSLGVRVVQHPGPLHAADTITAEITVRYGFNDGDYEFVLPFTGELQTIGPAVIGDVGSQEVVAVSPEGASHEVWAASGRGPGEVRRLRTLHVVGADSVWVEDSGNGKFMLLYQGQLLRTVPTRDIREVGFGLMAQAFNSSGQALMSTAVFMPDFEEPWLQGSLVRFDLDERTADTVGSFDLAARAPEGPRSPFFESGVLAVSGQSFVTGRTNEPWIRWSGFDGQLNQVVRWNPTPVYPVDGQLDQVMESMRSNILRINPGMSEDQANELVRQQMADVEVDRGQPLPYFGQVHGDDVGRVWIQPYAPGFNAMRSEFMVVAADGTRTTFVRFPEPLRILDILDDRVLGVVANDLDVQGIALYRIPSNL